MEKTLNFPQVLKKVMAYIIITIWILGRFTFMRTGDLLKYTFNFKHVEVPFYANFDYRITRNPSDLPGLH